MTLLRLGAAAMRERATGPSSLALPAPALTLRFSLQLLTVFSKNTVTTKSEEEDDEMAKGARSSVRKANNTKLKSRVFGPVEAARTERLSQKLMELASQPKASMDVEPQGKNNVAVYTGMVTLTVGTDGKETESVVKETQHADGALPCSLSIPIPKSMFSAKPFNTQNATLPTPPPTPPLDFAFPEPTNHAENERIAADSLFFHFLGVSTDVQGFDASGNLLLGFGQQTG